jgi:hypothetical protein
MDAPSAKSQPESRPSLRPLGVLVGALAATWVAAICLILIQL